MLREQSKLIIQAVYTYTVGILQYDGCKHAAAREYISTLLSRHQRQYIQSNRLDIYTFLERQSAFQKEMRLPDLYMMILLHGSLVEVLVEAPSRVSPSLTVGQKTEMPIPPRSILYMNLVSVRELLRGPNLLTVHPLHQEIYQSKFVISSP